MKERLVLGIMSGASLDGVDDGPTRKPAAPRQERAGAHYWERKAGMEKILKSGSDFATLGVGMVRGVA
jgi:hypothetical protein